MRTILKWRIMVLLALSLQRTKRPDKVEHRSKVEDCCRCGWLFVGEERTSKSTEVDKSTKRWVSSEKCFESS